MFLELAGTNHKPRAHLLRHCPHCNRPLPEPPMPPEVDEAVAEMIARTAEIIGAELEEDDDVRST